MGEMFGSVGYAAAILGKWHLGSAPESLPTARSPGSGSSTAPW
ncbi:hypothetical protein [Amaricoccus solimangrovi]|nr:hypothetical protein [Amaricoccus solimangrovi]